MACTVAEGLALPNHRVTDDFGGSCGSPAPALPDTCRRRLADGEGTKTVVKPVVSSN